MKIILLTTETTHHQYFLWKVIEKFPVHSVLLEDSHVTPPFPTHHQFETQRDEYERQVLLKGCPCGIQDFTETKIFTSINELECVSYLQQEQPDVMLVFGTGKLKHDVFKQAKVSALNLHGGNPEKYRGLDTHLWAIYHKDFNNVVTTLHHLAPNLDTGAIVMETQLTWQKQTQIYELRSINTQACIDMCNAAILLLNELNWLPGRQQHIAGRYYSSMPAELKEICVQRFNHYSGNL